MARADAAADGCRDLEQRISLLANIVGSMVASGSPAMDENLARLPDAATTLAEQRQLARAHCNLGDSFAMIGAFDRGRDHLRRGLRLAEESGALYVLGTARSTDVRLDWFTGEWNGLAERATSLLAEYRDLMPVATELNLVLGLLALATGEWQNAAAHLADTGVRTPRDAISPVVFGGAAGLIRLALRNNDPVRAALEADAGVTLLRRKEVWAWAGELAPAAVDAYLAAGRRDAAEDLVASLEKGIHDVVAPMASAALLTCLGALTGDPAHHSVAAAAYTALGAPYLAAQADERAAGTTEALTELIARYEVIGAAHDAARCRHQLRTAGIATPSRQGRRGYGSTLSPREREVARLLAAGHTNNEIAETLFLSPRTVEQHASKVLKKLRRTSRRDIRATDLA